MSVSRQTIRGFIVLEGIDGTGTTTQLEMLAARAEKCGVPFDADREPTGGPIGALIRGALSGELPFDQGTIAHLFAADRHEHVFGSNGVAARCAAGRIVASDRYFFSSLAYQGLAFPGGAVRRLNEGFPLPELSFYFSLPVDEAMRRIERRNGAREIYEKRGFLAKVHDAYDAVFDEYERLGARIVRIDATETRERIHETIASAVAASCGVRFGD